MLSLAKYCVAGALLTAAAVFGPTQTSLAGGMINKDAANIAIQGYDPVAYFTDGRPVEGNPEFAEDWHDATWLFSSAANQQKFAADPEHFAPRYGGFCSGAMALGMRAPIDPHAWAIVDGKLYLNYSKDGIRRFEKDAEHNIAKADENWKSLGRAN